MTRPSRARPVLVCLARSWRASRGDTLATAVTFAAIGGVYAWATRAPWPLVAAGCLAGCYLGLLSLAAIEAPRCLAPDRVPALRRFARSAWAVAALAITLAGLYSLT